MRLWWWCLAVFIGLWGAYWTWVIGPILDIVRTVR